MVPIFGHFGLELFVDDLGGAFPLPKEVEDAARANGIKDIKYGKLDDFISEVDALMLTRGLQKGIIDLPKDKEDAVLKLYRPINKEHMKKLRKDAILYMIKPKIFEVERDVDSDQRTNLAVPEPFSEAGLAVLTYLLGIKV